MAKRGRFPRGGMPNMNNMMKQMQKMQKDMEEAQEKVEQTEFTASAGGGSVEVTMNGKREVVSVNIDKEVVDPDDVEMLQDLLMVAVNDALNQVNNATEESMGKFTGGLNVPGLF